MRAFLPFWLLLLGGLAACAGPGAAPSRDGCAAIAAQLGRRMAGSGVALPGQEHPRSELIAALRLANLQLVLSQEAASRLFECRAAQAGAVREDQAAGRIWGVTAEFRVARIRAALREEIEAAIAVSERIGAADAALVAAASAGGADRRQAAELRGLATANAARREGFEATVMLAGRITDIEMDRDGTSR